MKMLSKPVDRFGEPKRKLLGMLAVAVCASAVCTGALAQRGGGHGHGRGGAPGWHGDIARFHEHDWGVWRGGHWTQARHAGRVGWWWVVGGSWYFYPWPVYPYPNPWVPAPSALVPGEVVPPVPPTQYWYYCDSSRTYYPYTAICAEGWKQVPATPAGAGK